MRTTSALRHHLSYNMAIISIPYPGKLAIPIEALHVFESARRVEDNSGATHEERMAQPYRYCDVGTGDQDLAIEIVRSSQVAPAPEVVDAHKQHVAKLIEELTNLARDGSSTQVVDAADRVRHAVLGNPIATGDDDFPF